MPRRKKPAVEVAPPLGTSSEAPPAPDILAGAVEEFHNLIAKDEELKKITDRRLLAVGDESLDADVTGYVSTQCPMLNWAIGRPGIPRGRMTTIIGLEASGKSTALLHILAETQRIGGIAALIDAERRHWRERAERIGLDHDRLVQLQGATLEENLELIEKFVRAVRTRDPNIPLTIGYDSVAGSPTKADLDGSYGDAIPAKHARLLAIGMRRIHPLIARERVALVMVNQLRDKLQFGFTLGRPQMVMLGEHPLTYWSSVKLHLQQAQRLGEADAPTGITVNCEILKNTVAPPFRKCQFNIDFQTGIDAVGSALDLAVKVGIIEGKSGWYRYEGYDKSFQRGDFADVLAQHPELQRLIAAAPLLWTEGGN